MDASDAGGKLVELQGGEVDDMLDLVQRHCDRKRSATQQNETIVCEAEREVLGSTERRGSEASERTEGTEGITLHLQAKARYRHYVIAARRDHARFTLCQA